MIGRVVSTKLKNTATVLVERQATDPLYKKTFVRSKKYLVDNTLGVKDGDIVEIEKCRPVSKMKHFKIVKVLGQNLAEIARAHLKEKAEEAIAQVMPEESSEHSENSDGQNVRRSDRSESLTHRYSDTPISSDTPSSSEFSGKRISKQIKVGKGGKTNGTA